MRLQSDEKLVALIRDGHDRAFEVLFDRYQSRLLMFCRHLVGTVQDAEDVLQEVFVAAHTAMLADERAINARPWLYRIARNRCLNFLRRPAADGQDTMDMHVHSNGTTTLEQVQRREEIREIFADVRELPETQRTALVLREIDDLSYTEIAQAMGTTLPSVKSLLVRARMSLAEAGEARILTCDEVRLELAEAAEGLVKVTGPGRRHVRSCERCRRYRGELRSSSRALGALAPFGLIAFFRKLLGVKLGGGSAASGAGASGAGATGGAAAAAGGSSFGGAALTAGGAALGAKAAVGVATAALITAGAVGVNDLKSTPSNHAAPTASVAAIQPAGPWQPIHRVAPATAKPKATPIADAQSSTAAPPSEPSVTQVPAPATTAAPPPPTAEPQPQPTDTSSGTSDASAGNTSASDTGSSSGDTTAGGSSSGDGTTVDPAPAPDPTPVTPTDPVPPPDPVTTPDQPPTDSSGSDAPAPADPAAVTVSVVPGS